MLSFNVAMLLLPALFDHFLFGTGRIISLFGRKGSFRWYGGSRYPRVKLRSPSESLRGNLEVMTSVTDILLHGQQI